MLESRVRRRVFSISVKWSGAPGEHFSLQTRRRRRRRRRRSP